MAQMAETCCKETMFERDKTTINCNNLKSDTVQENELKETSNKQILKTLDGGYGWVIVFASFCIQFIEDGISYSFGMFFVKITKEYPNVGKGGSSWITSIMAAMTYGIGGPVASILVNRFGTRTVSIVGTLVATTGFALSYFAVHPSIMYLTVGVLGGLGFGLMYLPAIVSVPKYFDRKQAFAMGICVAGSGSGTLFFELIVNLILANYEWRQGLLIAAGIIALSLPLAFFYRPQDDPVRHCKSSIVDTEVISSKESFPSKNRSCCQNLIDLTLLTNSVFILFSTSDILTSVGFNVPYVYLPEIEQKLTNSTSTTTLGYMGGSNVIARLVLGYISDKQFVNRRYMYIFGLMTAGLTTVISPHLTSITLVRIYAALYGTCGGLYISFKSILLVDLLGLDRLTDSFGLLSLMQGIGFIVGCPIVGFLYDRFGSYNLGFYFAGFMIFTSGAMLIFIPQTQRREHRKLSQLGKNNLGFSHYPEYDKDNPDPSNGIHLESFRSTKHNF